MKEVLAATLQKGEYFYLRPLQLRRCQVTNHQLDCIGYTCEDGSYGGIATWKKVWITNDNT